MKPFLLLIVVALASVSAHAQITNVALQASGLTCSMCSKAVKTALDKVPFVEKVDVDLKSQEYNLTFKKDTPIDLDALSKAVEDAGFSVARLKVTANLGSAAIAKDAHIKIGDQVFHFLNATGQPGSGSTSFSVVDKHFVSAKVFKKWSTASGMECTQTGKAGKCCTSDGVAAGARVYHAVI